MHRDVKPGNVLFRKDGRVVLADFGIAKAMDGSNSSTVAGASIGTPDYMSPEQARGEPVDGRSDLYSLGTVIFEMLTGSPPYQAGDPFTVALMHVTHPVPELPEPYEWLQPLITGLMAKQAGDRYNTGAAFVDALNKLVATAPQGAVLQETSARKAAVGGRIAAGAATQQRTRIRARQHGSRPGWVLPSAAAIVIFALAVSAWWLLSPSPEPAADAPVVTTATTPPESADVALPEDFVLPKAVDAADGEEVERLLNAADQLYEYATKTEIGRKLDHPEDDSALGYYRRALAMDPGNARAIAGIAEVVKFYRTYSYQACERGQWVQCGFLVRKGLAVDDQDPYLRQMQEAARAGEAGETTTLPPAPPG